VLLKVQPGDVGWQEIQPLSALVYPPEVLATIVWRDVTWALAERWVLAYDEKQLVSAVGLYPRNGLHDGSKVRIGGIGGVMTDPAHRARGFATAALGCAQALFREIGTDFSLLFSEPKNFAFYTGLGWRVFADDVMVDQPGGRGPFTVTTAMVRDIGKPAPLGGTIDLCGLPW
jgi:aminoglycoside 2'-N-acetyltransferase I